jgi:hypothetical protein
MNENIQQVMDEIIVRNMWKRFEELNKTAKDGTVVLFNPIVSDAEVDATNRLAEKYGGYFKMLGKMR